MFATNLSNIYVVPQFAFTIMLKTETPNAIHARLDEYATPELVGAFIDDQLLAGLSVRAAAAQLAAAVDAAAPRLARGGRLVYVGAGTSGRLGLLDSVELYPTFSWPKERAIALLAGGMRALREAVEGAEDNFEQGAKDVVEAKVVADDVVIALAASGATPYALGALAAAREAGALTIGIANNVDAPVAAAAEVGITLDTGPEVISGSTRLKAGTSQKIALNTLSSAIMVRLNKVYGNLMVDVKPTNAKLIARTIRLTMLATQADEPTARLMLESCDYHVKTAIVGIRCRMSADQARAVLERTQGSVRAALTVCGAP
jgi:N-acetylmuramic acid 6-phosphate etherase